MWKIFALATFASQVIRVPVLIYMLPSIEYIKAYIISASLLLPIYFISNEVLTFNSKENRYGGRTISMIVLIVVATVFYFINTFGFNYIVIFFQLALSSILVGISYSKIRERSSSYGQIKYEAVYSMLLTFGMFFLTSVNNNYFDLPKLYSGYTLVLSVILFLHSLNIIPMLIGKRLSVKDSLRFFDKYNKFKSRGSDSGASAISNAKQRNITGLIFILLVSQYERGILGVYAPIYLVYINIAGGVLSGIRRIVGNDYIVYEKVLKIYDYNFRTLHADFVRYFRIYIFIALLSLLIWILLHKIKYIPLTTWTGSRGIDLNLFLIFSIYCITSPCSIFLNAYFRRGDKILSPLNWAQLITIWVILNSFIFASFYYLKISPVIFIAGSCFFECLFLGFFSRKCNLKINGSFCIFSCISIIFVVFIASGVDGF